MQINSCWSWLLFRRWYWFNTLKKLKLTIIIIGISFFILFLFTLILYLPIQQYRILYAQNSKCLQINNHHNHTICQIKFQIESDIQPPIQVLYFIQNIYINHRKYINSYSVKQLKGQIIDSEQAEKQCTPIIYNHDLQKKYSYGGYVLDPDIVCSPCGLKAMLMFNDTFILKNQKLQTIFINQKNITKQKGIQYNQQLSNPSKFQWINPQDQHFIIWMRSQSLMTKKKLWGRINETLKAGNYTLKVQNNYQIGNQRLRKGIQITTTSIIGGILWPITFTFLAITIICVIYVIWISYKYSNIDNFGHQ